MTKARYQIITNALTQQIINGKLKPGDRIPSSSELCNIYSVSQITALRVFKELTTANFISKKEGRGYYVNGAAAINNDGIISGSIGSFLRPLRPCLFDDNFFNEINCAIQNEVGKRRFNLLWSYSCSPLNEHYIPPAHLQAEIKRAALTMADKVDGFLLDERISDETIDELLIKIRKPMLLINRKTKLPIDTVNCADKAGAAKLVETALKFGYENFIICAPGHSNIEDRVRYIEKSLSSNGIAKDRITVIPKCLINPYETSIKALFKNIEAGQKKKTRTLIFCVTDLFARPVCDDLLAAGLKPGEDLGLVSFGGFSIATMKKPEIATVDMKSTDMGIMAVDRLLYKIANPFVEAKNHTPDFELCLGDTI